MLNKPLDEIILTIKDLQYDPAVDKMEATRSTDGRGNSLAKFYWKRGGTKKVFIFKAEMLEHQVQAYKIILSELVRRVNNLVYQSEHDGTNLPEFEPKDETKELNEVLSNPESPTSRSIVEVQ